jgi:uncharacterized membrane protein HdeD (DUF308 family)
MANSMTNSMTNPIAGAIHKSTTWSILLSVMMIAAGVLALLSPAIAGVAVTVFFGWLLIFSGILHVAYAWQSGRPGGIVWEILVGILYGGIGLYLLERPIAGLESLTLALAFYLVAEALLEFLLSLQLRPLPGSGWLLFDGIVTLVLAATIGGAWPISSAWAIGTVVGVSMFFSGVTRLALAVAVRRVVT